MDSEREVPEVKEKIILQVVGLTNGQIKVVGEILTDEMATYGVLEVVKNIVRKSHEEAKSSMIKPVEHRMLNFLRNGKK